MRGFYHLLSQQPTVSPTRAATSPATSPAIAEENAAIIAEREHRNHRLKIDAVVSAAILRAHASVALNPDGEHIYPFTAGYVNSGTPAGVPRIADDAELRQLLTEALAGLSPLVDWSREPSQADIARVAEARRGIAD